MVFCHPESANRSTLFIVEVNLPKPQPSRGNAEGFSVALITALSINGLNAVLSGFSESFFPELLS
jgi:hypothetical protein